MNVEQSLELANALGTWVAGIATFLAVYYARKIAQQGEGSMRATERRRAAAELYSEFSSPEMESARFKAWTFLCKNRESLEPLSFEAVHKDDATLAPLTQVIQFWEKTWHFLEAQYVDAHLTKRLLRHYFESYCRDGLLLLAQTSREETQDLNLVQWVVAIEELARVWNLERRASD